MTRHPARKGSAKCKRCSVREDQHQGADHPFELDAHTAHARMSTRAATSFNDVEIRWLSTVLEVVRQGGKPQDFAVLIRHQVAPDVIGKVRKMAKRPRARAT